VDKEMLHLIKIKEEKMMKNLTKILCLLLAVLMVAGLFAGCNQPDDDDATIGTPPADPDAPYEETVTLTTFFEIAGPIQSLFDPSQLTEYKLLKDMTAATNIKLDYLWHAADTADDAETKKNNAIATGEIPDFMLVSSAQLALLAKSDLINKNIGQYFDMYASDTLKAWTNADGTAALDSATYGGKVIAIPLVDSSIDSAAFLWIRKDWLNNLGLEAPTTLDELYAVMKAFKENDPDQDGKDDTVGIALHKNFLGTGTADCYGLFNGFGAYPGYWVEDGKGGLTYGSTTPEAKKALEYLAKAYKDGLIQEDFSVKDEGGTTELTASSVAGIQYGAMWNPAWPLNMTYANDPNCDWIACPIPGLEGIGNPGIALRVTDYVVVSAECEHPEAVVKILNWWCQTYAYSDDETYESYFEVYNEAGEKQFPLHHMMLKTWNPTKNLDIYYAVKDAVERNDTSKLNAEQMSTYKDVSKFLSGDPESVGSGKIFAPEGSAFHAMSQYAENKMFFINKFTGAQTPTMSKKMSIIEDKVYEYYTKVIMGIESIDSFDAFVAELGNLGLTDITAEVNEWYKK
jgi:putative aldouronate transport system substrate-binding protein